MHYYVIMIYGPFSPVLQFLNTDIIMLELQSSHQICTTKGYKSPLLDVKG